MTFGRRLNERPLGGWCREPSVAEVFIAHQTTGNALLQQLLAFTRWFHEPYQVQVVARGEVEG